MLINDALDYNINDILCIPRNYCETMKRKKCPTMTRSAARPVVCYALLFGFEWALIALGGLCLVT